LKKILALMIIVFMSLSGAYAKQGDNGFEGGVSSGGLMQTMSQSSKNEKQIYSYKEIVVLTGVPLIFEGNVTITKTIKDNLETYNYSYALSNGEKNKLTRTCVYEAYLSKSGTQTIRTINVKQGSKPRESITIDGLTYNLTAVNNQNFSLSTITDSKPACDYYAGDLNSEKVYQTNKGKKVTVRMTGRLYGYDQNWGATEIQDIKVSIYGETNQNNISDIWGGDGAIKIITTTSNKLIYVPNKPDAISFEGGYLRKQENNSVLKYDLNLPTFDSKNVATDNVVNYNGTLNISSFPQQERLSVPDISAIKGHWYEEDIKQLTSLGILNRDYIKDYTKFGEAITRAQFAKAAAEAIKLELLDVPIEDTKSKKNKTPVEKLPFEDVDENNEYYKYIYTLYKKGIMSGMSETYFYPDAPLSRAQAVVIFVRMLGLESIVSGSSPVTGFSDNDIIPDWARNAVAVATKIGLVNGDEQKYLKPNNSLSKAEAATLLNNLIKYMREGMAQDYKTSINFY